jgi:hypothetical protein
MVPLVDMTQAYKDAIRQSPDYRASVARGVGFPEDVSAGATSAAPVGMPAGAIDRRTIGGKTYYKFGPGDWRY